LPGVRTGSVSDRLIYDSSRSLTLPVLTFTPNFTGGFAYCPKVGGYTNSSPGFPLKITVTRDAAVLYAQATGQSAFPFEATAADKFKSDTAGVVIEFNAEKNQMTLKQGGREFIFTKEK
jgi:hypothetical protein